MKDTIIKGTGNSRYLKSAIPESITHQELVDMLIAGTFPVDLNGINADGIEQQGTALNKATLLTDETAAAIWPDEAFRPADPTVDDALGVLPGTVQVKENEAEYEDAFAWERIPIPVTPSQHKAAAYGDGVYVVVSGYNAYVSEDRQNWDTVVISSTNTYNRIAYGGGTFVAISTTGSTNHCAYSTDKGRTWTESTFPSAKYMHDIAYGDKGFVVIAGSQNSGAFFFSATGKSWSTAKTWSLSEDYAQTWSAVGYGNGRYVAISYPASSGTTSRVAYSTSGSAWTDAGALTINFRAPQIIFRNGYFYSAMGASTSTFPYLHKSADGVAWESVSDISLNINSSYSRLFDMFGEFWAPATGTQVTIITRVSDGFRTGIRAQSDFTVLFLTEDEVWIRDNTGVYSPKKVTGEQYRITNPDTGESTMLSRFVTGSYIGTGLAGVRNPNEVHPGFSPCLLVVTDDVGETEGSYNTSSDLRPAWGNALVLVAPGNGVQDIGLVVEWGKTVRWYSRNASNDTYNYSGAQMNISGQKYYYAAIG